MLINKIGRNLYSSCGKVEASSQLCYHRFQEPKTMEVDAMGRPKRQNRQNVNITCNAEDVAVVNYVLRPVGVSMSSFLNAYLHSMTEAIREFGITKDTFQNFTMGEIQKTFEKLHPNFRHRASEKDSR